MVECEWKVEVACSYQRALYVTTPSSPPFPSPRTGFLHWREELVGDSDSESDDDTRAVVGLNADWTKEMDPENIIDQ